MDTDTVYSVQSGVWMDGDIVTLRNVVVTVEPTVSSTSQGFWVQDVGGGEYSGIRVYLDDTTDAGITEGSVIDVTGTVVEYFDLTQIQPLSVDDIVMIDTVMEPTVDVVDPETTTDWEPWEGVLVQFDDVVVGADVGFGEHEITIGDDMVPFRIDDMVYADVDAVIGEGDTLDSVVGFVHYSYSNWKLQPRDADDLIGLTTYEPPPPSLRHRGPVCLRLAGWGPRDHRDHVQPGLR